MAQRFTRVWTMMRSPVLVDVRDDLPSTTLDTVSERVFGWLCTVDMLFSTHRSGSQVNLLDLGLLSHKQADPLVREVLTACARLTDRTEGYFDMYATGRLAPTRYVRGWAVQEASKILVQVGARNHCLSTSGHLIASGAPGLGQKWPVALHDPVHRQVTWVLPISDQAVSTCRSHGGAQVSGVAGVAGVAGGEVIVDPVARCPAPGPASVTVIGPDLGVAAAYATAAVAMGPAARDWFAGVGPAYAFSIIDAQGRRFNGGERLASVMDDTAEGRPRQGHGRTAIPRAGAR